MSRIRIVLAGLAAGGLLGAQGLQESHSTLDRAPAEARLYIFLSPTDRDLATLAGEVLRAMAGFEKRGMRPEIRPVLLLSDFKCVGQLHTDEPFFSMVKELGAICGPGFEIRLYDEDGLAWAERLAIERTPAWALVRGDRVHLAYGTRARIDEVTSCGGR